MYICIYMYVTFIHAFRIYLKLHIFFPQTPPQDRTLPAYPTPSTLAPLSVRPVAPAARGVVRRGGVPRGGAIRHGWGRRLEPGGAPVVLRPLVPV